MHEQTVRDATRKRKVSGETCGTATVRHNRGSNASTVYRHTGVFRHRGLGQKGLGQKGLRAKGIRTHSQIELHQKKSGSRPQSTESTLDLTSVDSASWHRHEDVDFDSYAANPTKVWPDETSVSRLFHQAKHRNRNSHCDAL